MLKGKCGVEFGQSQLQTAFAVHAFGHSTKHIHSELGRRRLTFLYFIFSVNF